MPRQCTICEHPDRATLELGIANAVPMKTLARRHGISHDALIRHKRNHMPPQLLAALKTRGRATEIDLDHLRVTESEGLLQHLVALRGRFYRLLDSAEELGDFSAAARTGGQLLKNLELTAKLLGDLQTGSQQVTQNILVLPEYHGLRTAIVQALSSHPEARSKVIAALQHFEAPAIEGEARVVSGS